MRQDKADITDAGPRLKAMNDRLDELRTAADLADAEYRQEIASLRLTDDEQEALQWCLGWCEGLNEKKHATLRGLLERCSQFAKSESNSPQPIATPNPPSTPGECTVPPWWTSRPYWVDPPSGWRYGFPRLYNPAKDGDMTQWMIRNGYPEHLARQDLPCTFTAKLEDVEK